MEENILKVLITEEQIKQRIEEMGAELSREYAGKDPVVLGVLKGVVVFYADMIRKITVPCQMDFMCLSSYKGTQSTGTTIVKQAVVAAHVRHPVPGPDEPSAGQQPGRKGEFHKGILLRMKNEELRMKNFGISFGNDLYGVRSGHHYSSFIILHFAL